MTAVSKPRQALAGVTVLDLATYLAAPVCATLFGEFGADVIKVEQPRVGDDLRRLGRPVAPSAGGSYWWFVESRNKKSITCNLRDPEGQALICRLVAGTHVVTENFRPGTLERWNLGWSELSRIRPSLVMVRISAFGQTGPNRERPGFGRIAAAVGGLAYLAGYPDRAPVSPGTPTVPDYLAGVFGAVGALVALRHAERTGEGRSSISPSTSRCSACSTTRSPCTAARARCVSGSAPERRARSRTITIGRATGAGSRSPAPTIGCSRGCYRRCIAPTSRVTRG
jgi:crotonobetainyl-CoA:carnitine CoA-transferase CaiB-like acyl-CoA transferase